MAKKPNQGCGCDKETAGCIAVVMVIGLIYNAVCPSKPDELATAEDVPGVNQGTFRADVLRKEPSIPTETVHRSPVNLPAPNYLGEMVVETRVKGKVKPITVQLIACKRQGSGRGKKYRWFFRATNETGKDWSGSLTVYLYLNNGDDIWREDLGPINVPKAGAVGLPYFETSTAPAQDWGNITAFGWIADGT